MMPTTVAQWFALLLDSTFKSSLIIVMALVATVALRRKSAALRHLVWSVGLMAVVLLPFCTMLTPALHTNVAVSIMPALFAPAPQIAPPPSAHPGVTVQAGSAVATGFTPVRVAMLVWLLGCLTVSAVLTVESLRLVRIANRAEPFRDARWMFHASELSRIFDLKRPVRFLQNPSESMLVTWGALRPRVLLPSDADNWPEHRVRAVLGHELAHVGRFDWLVQVVAEVVRAIYWFNPLVWFGCNRLRQEGERACDDAVLTLGIDGTEYAAHVLDVVRTLKASSRRWSPALAMARRSNLERRFAAMLNISLDRRAASRKAVFLVALAALCILLPLSALRSSAQVQAGRFNGTVTDPNGTPVPNATVTVSNDQAGLRQITGTLADGSFDLQGLPTGTFSVVVLSSSGERLLNTITMQPNQSVQLDFRLTGVSAPPRPPSPPPPVARIRQGGNVQSAMLVQQVPPVYPKDLKAAHIEGIVIMESVIGKDGRVMSVRIVSGDVAPALGKAAVEAVSQWRYQPTLLNGEPVEVVTTTTVNFAIRN